MDRNFTRDRVGAFAKRSRMVLHQVGLADHIVVEEQQDIARGLCGSSIARGSKAAIFLFDYPHRKRAIQLGQQSGGPIGRAVDHDDDLDRSVVG